MKPATPCVLTINGGSSSIKFALFEADAGFRRILAGQIAGIGLPQGDFTVKGLDPADAFSRPVTAPNHTVAVGVLMDWVEERITRGTLAAVGHRVVHGGPKYWEPQRITGAMIAELRQLSPFDPEHLPEEILLTEAFHHRFPDVPQVACFDTAFHHRMPRVARLLRTPKGWTGPKFVDGKQVEGTFRAHQVPMGDMEKPAHIKILERWMKSYKPHELFNETGRLRPELAQLAPKGDRRMSANPHTNGGLLLRELKMPDFRDYAVKVPKPGAVVAEATRVQGQFIRDVMKLNPESFRVFSPDEAASNRWNAVFEVSDRCSTAEILPSDEHVSPEGRVMEMLSEHQCEGWPEGYLLTGRHGFFSCYEAFIHIVDSMFNQHAKWLKVTRQIPWRRPIASLNYLLSSLVWRQDHNGFSHQDPGFIDHVVNKKAEVIRVYLPPDANTLLSVTDHCLRSRNYVNVIVSGKQPELQWLDMDAAVKHCTAGLGIWEWASNDRGGEPDVVMACAGDVPTLETLAAVQILREQFPDLKVRVINVVDLMTLQPQSEHPHGLSDKDFDALFTKDKPLIFAFHGYPWLIHRLTYRRTNHQNLHVRGYKEEGTTTTPFDMVVLNDLDRFHLVGDVVDRVPSLGARAAYAKQVIRDRLIDHKNYVCQHGDDMPEIRDWRWHQ
jgi:xylulose-5-phosphate/fructose-6-phosphate phosphoketolase